MKRILTVILCALMLVGAQASASNFYLIPDSDTRELTEAELWEWQYEALGYILNEIFARHGYHFEPGGKYESYFEAQTWYHENEVYATNQEIYDHLMTGVEWRNERLVKDVRAQMRALGTRNEYGRALPAVAYEPEIAGAFSSFEEIFLPADKRLAVYSGPGTSYYRGANGKAMASTNGRIYAGGWENGYLMIMYWTNEGSVRVGYASSQDVGQAVNVPQLQFAYQQASITRDCTLTDDPAMTRQVLARLAAGSGVTYLGSYVNSNAWAYVEIWVDGQAARGFVPADCVAVAFQQEEGEY